MQTVYYLVLVPMVYAAFAVFIFGTAWRLVQTARRPAHGATLQIFPKKDPAWLYAVADTFLMPSILRHSPVLWFFLAVFHLAVALLIIGHLELFAQWRLLQIVPHEVFLGKGFVGLAAAVSLLFLFFRRFHAPVRDLSVPEDYYLLILLFLTVIFGSQMDWARRWFDYDVLGVEAYRAYLWSLVTLKPFVPDEIVYSGHGFMLVLHVFFANVFLMVFPFTKMMHTFLALPMNLVKRG